jgi:hypothetical protein
MVVHGPWPNIRWLRAVQWALDTALNRNYGASDT